MKKIREPFNGFSHLLGAVAVIPLTIVLICQSVNHATVWHVVAYSIFGLSMFLLYAASAMYHLLPLPEHLVRRFKRIDHMMIFILIAGTYTPICLVPLRGAWGWSLFGVVWGVAIAGIVLKVIWLDAPRWLSTGLYILMGWIVVIASYPLVRTVTTSAFVFLLIGGVVYTLGGVIYALKWPRIKNVLFGFHELFHLFVIGGSVFHILFMFKLIGV